MTHLSSCQQLVSTVLAALFLGHCAAIRPESQAERLLAAGNLERAAAAFERVLVGSPTAREAEAAHYRLGLIYSTPGPTFDPMHGRLNLAQLLDRFPTSRFRTEAASLLALTEQLARLEAAVRIAEDEVTALASSAASCQARTLELDEEVSVLYQMGIEEAASRRACDQAMASLRRRSEEREQEIGRLHDAVAALEALRRIDTRREPGG